MWVNKCFAYLNSEWIFSLWIRLIVRNVRQLMELHQELVLKVMASAALVRLRFFLLRIDNCFIHSLTKFYYIPKCLFNHIGNFFNIFNSLLNMWILIEAELYLYGPSRNNSSHNKSMYLHVQYNEMKHHFLTFSWDFLNNFQKSQTSNPCICISQNTLREFFLISHCINIYHFL